MTSDAALPAVVARMWGRQPVRRKGPEPRLTAATIVDAAIAIAEERGLDAVTMGRLGESLGVTPMALYRHVGSKDELLLVMADAVAPDPPDPHDLGWRRYLQIWTRANHDHLLAHPWVLDLPPAPPPLGPRSLRWLDRAIAALSSTGLDEQRKLAIASTLAGYAVASARQAHAATAPGSTTNATDGPDDPAGYAALLAQLLDADQYPALSRAVHAGAFGDQSAWVDDDDFEFGLDLYLDGIEQLVANRPR